MSPQYARCLAAAKGLSRNELVPFIASVLRGTSRQRLAGEQGLALGKGAAAHGDTDNIVHRNMQTVWTSALPFVRAARQQARVHAEQQQRAVVVARRNERLELRCALRALRRAFAWVNLS